MVLADGVRPPLWSTIAVASEARGGGVASDDGREDAKRHRRLAASPGCVRRMWLWVSVVASTALP